MNKNRVTAIITIFLTFILFIILQPGDDPLAMVRIASIVAAAVLILIVIYNHFLWKVEPFKRLHKIVDISGKWEGKLPIGNGKEILVEVTIKQYYDDVSIELVTDHNRSESLVTRISSEADGNKLYVVYKNKNSKKIESKDDIDYGTMMLRLDEDLLEGEFFNSKNISGRIELYRKE